MNAPQSPAYAVGKKLVELCRQGKNLEAIDTLYGSDIVSVEAAPSPGFEDPTMRGIDAIRGKNRWWLENHTVHKFDLDGPYPHGDDRFAVVMALDVTPKAGPMAGQRMSMSEIGVYTVQAGKIVKEEFFWSM